MTLKGIAAVPDMTEHRVCQPNGQSVVRWPAWQSDGLGAPGRYSAPMTHERIAAAVFAAALASCLSGAAGACALDGAYSGNPFALAHPRSLEVAMAVHEAVRGGRFELETPVPALDGEVGLQRTGWRLRQLGRALGDAQQGDAPIALVLVDIGLWARLAPAPLGLQLQLHVAGPLPGDVVAVSSEAVLAQWVAGRLGGEEALRHGLLLLEGEPADVQRAADRFARIGAAPR